MAHDIWQSPLIGRYSSREMQELWSDDRKFQTWREIWTAHADGQRALGVSQITGEAISQMRANLKLTEEDYPIVAKLEREKRHDVMAHAIRFGQLCPAAAPIIHLAGTSMLVDDNTYLILMREGLRIIAARIAQVVDRLAQFADTWKGESTLGYTHLQPAQPVTVGKRACLWMQDLLWDLHLVEETIEWLPFLGAKGTTGTRDSYVDLFEGDCMKAGILDRTMASSFGFKRLLLISGQTYPRKVDTRVLTALAEIGQSAHKMGDDLRLLQHLKEVEEPFEKEQVGSSAMAYKRNPMRSERCCSLARLLMGAPGKARQTASQQWFERTLDDSAGRRDYIPGAFLTADAVLKLLQNISEGLVVFPAMIRKHLMEELPFMATEHIITAMVRAGVNRQEAHESIRVHAQAAGNRIKQEGVDNDLIKRLKADGFFAPVRDSLDEILDPKNFIGQCVQQVDEFIAEEVKPALEPYADQLGGASELKV